MNPVSDLEGPRVQTNPKSFVATVPFNTIGDYENFLTRLETYPKQVCLNDEEVSTIERK